MHDLSSILKGIWAGINASLEVFDSRARYYSLSTCPADVRYRYGDFRPDHLREVVGFWEENVPNTDIRLEKLAMGHHKLYPDLFLIAKQGRNKKESNRMLGTIMAVPTTLAGKKEGLIHHCVVDLSYPEHQDVCNTLAEKIEERLHRRGIQSFYVGRASSNVVPDFKPINPYRG